MVMYPYILEKLTLGSSIQDENGDWTKAEEKWEYVGVCRDETNVDRLTKSEDSSEYVRSATIYLPKAKEITQGTKVRVLKEGKVKLEGNVLMFEQSMMHVRIWV